MRVFQTGMIDLGSRYASIGPVGTGIVGGSDKKLFRTGVL
jgi:hypothetical protein